MDIIKVEPDSDCEAQITSVCSDVKEEEQFIPIIKHEDEVGLHVSFSFHYILNLLAWCIESQRMGYSLSEGIFIYLSMKQISFVLLNQ
jgi:hypothetical protein